MLVEDELSRNPEILLMGLRMRKVAGTFSEPLSLKRLQTLLREAPVLIVMPDVGIEPVFWDQHALRNIVEERRSIDRIMNSSLTTSQKLEALRRLDRWPGD